MQDHGTRAADELRRTPLVDTIARYGEPPRDQTRLEAGGDLEHRGRTADDGTLRGLWYVAMAARQLKQGRMEARVLFGEPILFGRRRDGEVFAMRDLCPHRGMPLHHGSFDGETVQCPFHGWRFASDGACVAIPSLTPEQNIEIGRIRCPTYRCVERQGLIWIFLPERVRGSTEDAGLPPTLPDFGPDACPNAQVRLIYPCSFDTAAFGLIDPVHVGYVHGVWWLGKNARTLKLKAKHCEPCERGWTTGVHTAPKSFVYRIFGRDVETEILISLPGLRIERIIGERHHLLNLLAITPIDGDRTQMIQCLWWSMRGLGFLRPLIERIGYRFLKQDEDTMLKQREGLVFDPPTMLIPDADTQMRWWLRLKAEWIAHRREGRAFANPITPTTLRYRS